MKKFSRILSLILACVLLLLCLSGCAATKRPLCYVKNAVVRSLRQGFGGDLLGLLTAVTDGGSAELVFGGTDAFDTALQSGSATLYFSDAKSAVAASTQLTLFDRTYDAQLWLSEKTVVMSSAAFFGSNVLGADLDSLADDLKNSIFRNNSGTAFARPKIGDDTANAVNAWIEGVFSLYGSRLDFLELLDEHFEDFLKYVTEYAPYTAYSEKGQYYIGVTVNNVTLSSALRRSWQDAVGNRGFCRKMRELAATRDAMDTAAKGFVVTDATNKVEAWLTNNAEIEALCTKIDNGTPFTFALNATVRKLTGRLTSINVDYQSAEKHRGFSLDLSGDRIVVVGLILDGVARTLIVETQKNTGRAFEASFTYSRTEGEVKRDWQGSLSYNAKEGTYLCNMSEGGIARSFFGRFACDRNELLFAVDGMTVGESARRLQLSLSLKAKAKLPPTPDYTALPLITEARYAPIDERAKGELAAFKAAFAASGISLDSVKQKTFSLFGL